MKTMTAQRILDRLNEWFWPAEDGKDYARADAVIDAMRIVETARGPICCTIHQREHDNPPNVGYLWNGQ